MAPIDKPFVLIPAQVGRYFDRICLPHDFRLTSVAMLNDSEKLLYLTKLMKHSRVTIPVENLSMHYSWHHKVNVDREAVFEKVVGSNGRGGYGIELNPLFCSVLRSIGYHCHMAPARVWLAEHNCWTGLTHVTTIVRIRHTRYMVDVGSGECGPIRPLILKDMETLPQVHFAQSRVLHRPVTDTTNGDKVWIVQWRPDCLAEWTNEYSVLDTETIGTDLFGFNLELSAVTSPWHGSVFCMRFSLAKEAHGNPRTPDADMMRSNIDGSVNLHDGTLTWRQRGEVCEHSIMKFEAERMSCLRRYFGITLSNREEGSILGTNVSLMTWLADD